MVVVVLSVVVVWWCGGQERKEEGGLFVVGKWVMEMRVWFEDVGKEKQKERRVLYSSGFWTACD
jgi:hypothetical protein